MAKRGAAVKQQHARQPCRHGPKANPNHGIPSRLRLRYDPAQGLREGHIDAVAWDIYKAAHAALGSHRPEEALRLLAGQQAPDSPIWSKFACLEAECLTALGRYADAVSMLEQAAARGTSDYWVYYQLAVQYRLIGALDKAVEATRQAHARLGWQESADHGYTFTHDYFAANIPNWQTWFATLITAAPIACLEIGSWQGGSATWLLDKVVGPRGGRLTCVDTFEGSSEHAAVLAGLGCSLEQIFDQNIARTRHAALCHKLIGRSQDVLRWLHEERFDFIYVDGAHEAKYVIQDAVLSWKLLRDGGFLLFDDTGFEFPGRPEQNTHAAIAAFRTWFADEMEVLTPDTERQLLVRKCRG